jgi:hypothetical protein
MFTVDALDAWRTRRRHMLATMNAATKLAGISILILGSAAVAKLAGAKDIDTPSESANEAESSGNEPGTSDPPPVATSPFASTVIRAGVDANALAAAGVAAEGVAPVVDACEGPAGLPVSPVIP